MLCSGAVYLENIPQSYQVCLFGSLGIVHGKETRPAVDVDAPVGLVGDWPVDCFANFVGFHRSLLLFALVAQWPMPKK